jgi:hypothetical protein
MLRGRIVAANGVKAEDLRPPPSAGWVLQSDRGITHTADIPLGSRVVEGKWWNADYDGPPLLSFEKKIAEGLGLKIGDPVTVNVLGRNITANIANFRVVDWQSLGINFVLVYSPGAFRGAPPHRHPDLSARFDFAGRDRPAAGYGGRISRGDDRAREGRTRRHRLDRLQACAGDPRRQPDHLAGGRDGAGGRTGGKPP